MSIDYKPVLPSSVLSELDPKEVSFIQKNYDNAKLRVGVVVEIFETSDENNHSGVGPEYTIMTIEQHGSGGITTTTYKNCIALDSFGGVADFLQFKRRLPKDADKVRKSGSFKNQVGSTVLILCQDGVAEKGIIIGAISHPDKKPTLTKEKGHHLEGEFNGVNWQVDKDGALTVTFKSATDGTGKPASDKTGGTFVKMDKEGSVEVNTKLTGADETFVKIDKPNKDINVKAGNNIALTAKKNLEVKTEADVNMNITKNLLAKAEGTATIDSGGSFTLKAGGAMTIDVADLQIQSGSGMMVQTSQITLDAPLVNVGSGGSPAVIMTTKFLGTGNHGAPVVCSAIGPFSSSVFIGS